MKGKIIKTIFLIILTVLVFGAYNISRYQIDVSYSVIAADQLDTDSAYYMMEVKGRAIFIANFLMALVCSGLGAMGYKIWKTKKA